MKGPLDNDPETRNKLSVHHANILAYAEGMYYDRGHRDSCWTKYEKLTEHLAEADNETKELLKALKATLPALTLLGDFIGNAFGGKAGIEAFDRCQIIFDAINTIEKLERRIL